MNSVYFVIKEAPVIFLYDKNDGGTAMNLYSVLLVDDEEEVFQLIIKKLDWERMGFRIAGYARNGVEALEIAEELRLTPATASHHMGLLLSNQFVAVEKKDGKVYYRLNRETIEEMIRYLEGVFLS